MGQRLKFYGWGREGEGLDEDERSRVFRFAAEKLSVERSAAAEPPQASEITLRAPRGWWRPLRARGSVVACRG